MPLNSPVRPQKNGQRFRLVCPLNDGISSLQRSAQKTHLVFPTGGFLKPQRLMWSALNHTTCSLNMNYIHLLSTTPGLSPATDCHSLCWVIVQGRRETRWRHQPWSQWSDFDPANLAIRLLREEWASNPGWDTCVLCSPNVSLPPPSTSLSDRTQSEYYTDTSDGSLPLRQRCFALWGWGRLIMR